MSTLTQIPIDIIGVIASFISIRDRARLAQTSSCLRSRIEATTPAIIDPRIPPTWNRLHRWAANESRDALFPEMIAFLDITQIACRCMEAAMAGTRPRPGHMTGRQGLEFVWSYVEAHERCITDPWLNTRLVLEYGIRIGWPIGSLVAIACRLAQVDDTGQIAAVRVLHGVIQRLHQGDPQLETVQLVLGIMHDRDSPDTSRPPTGFGIVDAAAEGNLDSLVDGHLILEYVENIVVILARSGRKDLLEILEYRLGYKPRYGSARRAVMDDGNGDMAAWLQSR